MKEHEDRDMSSIEKSSAIVDSTAVEEIVTGEGKIEGVLGERDEGEDMMVDVVGADAIDLDRKTDSVRLIEECMQKETESRDLNMDMKEAAPAAGSGEDVSAEIAAIDNKELTERGSSVEQHVEESVVECTQKETETRDLNMDMEEAAVSCEDDSVGSRVLGFEKVEVTVDDEGLKTSIEVGNGEMAFESRGEPQFGGVDIAAIDNKELTERCYTVEQHLESVVESTQKETETRDLDMNMEEAAVSVEDDSVGSRVLGFEKVEVTVNEEGLKTSIEVRDCETKFESRGEPRFGGADIAAIDNKELTEIGSTVEHHVESVVECTQKETETHDLNMNMEEAAVSCEDGSVGNRVLGFEKVEVTVIEEGLNTSLEVSKDVLVTACGSLVQDSKESSIGGGEIAGIDNKDVIKRGSTEEVVEQHVESFNELADRDRVMDRKTKKEAEILDSSKIAESLEVDMIVMEGFSSKDEAKDCVFVDPSLVSANNQNSSTELVNVGSDEDAGRSKEESLQPTIEVITDDSQGNASGEPRFVGGENDLKNKEEESDRGLPKEIMEQPMECDQEMGVEDCTVNEEIVKESEPLDSSKISEPSTTTNPGSEDVDVVVVEAGLASKDEAQDGVSVDPNLVCADNRSLSSKVVDSATSEGDVIAQAENLDQQDEVIANDAQNLENGTGVRDSKSGVDSFSGEPRFDEEIAVIDIEETEKGLTAEDEETEKTGNGDEVLDSSKIQETLTAANLGPEEVLTTKIEVDEGTDTGGIGSSVESQSVKVNADVAACTEPGSSINRTTPVTANKVVKIESEDQNCIMYVEDQGLKAGAVCAKPSNEEMNGFRVSADAFEEVNGATPCADVVKHCVVVHEESGFSYEDGHMERGEDAGMDIDEVLGWKDEMPGIDVLSVDSEKDQNFKVNPDSEIAGNLVSLSGFKKRKVLDSISDGSEKRHPEKVPISTPKPSFKVGECIQRVASQLSGPPSVLKSNNDSNGQHVDQLVGPENVESKQSSVAEMLSQLHLVARDPMEGFSFLNTIIPFFYDHRAVGRPVGVRKRKTSNENEPEEFEFDDVNDSYWTDRIIQNHPEEQLLQDNQNGGKEQHHVVAYEPDKPAKPNRRSNKKRFLFSNHEMGLKEQSELVERRRQNLATEVVLKFPEGFYFPSEIHLNKMFRRFGALMESETEVDRQNGRARVVFKKCCDAEVAHSSAGKFSIFGPINVNYELNYTPLISYRPLPLSLLQHDSMDAS